MQTTSRQFRQLAGQALTDETLRAALHDVERVMPVIRQAAFDQLEDPETMFDRASAIRDRTLAELDVYLEAFEQKVEQLGGQVHWAADGTEACEIVADICESAGASNVTKSKSMVTEEIELNAFLQSRDMTVVETDLGEYIIQLRGERPSHILAPSLHVTLSQVAETFHQHHELQRDAPLRDPAEILCEARAVLRDIFMSADVGITGANFLVAETGGVVIVTNEGNADLTASLPDTHIVVTGIEKVVPTLEDVGLLLRLLARSAIGQRLSNYTTLIHGPRRAEDSSGPSNFHVVLLDNGRSDMLGTQFQEMLRCIRCSACINHCPVYTAVGGHAYGSVYSGPMGAVLTPGLAGLDAAAHLPNASTFCGRCEEVCPVRIPLPKMLRFWREREFERHMTPRAARYGLRWWVRLNASTRIYRCLLGIAARLLRALSSGGWVTRLPGPGRAWTRHRDLPAPAAQSFQQQWRRARSRPGNRR